MKPAIEVIKEKANEIINWDGHAQKFDNAFVARILVERRELVYAVLELSKALDFYAGVFNNFRALEPGLLPFGAYARDTLVSVAAKLSGESK